MNGVCMVFVGLLRVPGDVYTLGVEGDGGHL